MKLTTQLITASAVTVVGAMILDYGGADWTGATIFTIGCLLWIGVISNHFLNL